MQGQPLTRPTDPTHIAHAGTPNELWWDPASETWVKAPVEMPNIDKVVQVYNAIKDARTAKRRAWEKEDLALEADQDKLKVLLLGLLNATGAKSIATEHGTAYRTEKVRPSAADWNEVYAWIAADPQRFELLEKRLKSTFVKEYMETNEGAIPPGVNVHREFEVSIRRANTPTTNEGEE